MVLSLDNPTGNSLYTLACNAICVGSKVPKHNGTVYFVLATALTNTMKSHGCETARVFYKQSENEPMMHRVHVNCAPHVEWKS